MSFLNKLRLDGLSQDVGYKRMPDGSFESELDRQGEVSLYYSICEKKPSSRSAQVDRAVYIEKIDSLVEVALKEKEEGLRARADHVASLRALRLAKEAADKEAAENK